MPYISFSADDFRITYYFNGKIHKGIIIYVLLVCGRGRNWSRMMTDGPGLRANGGKENVLVSWHYGFIENIVIAQATKLFSSDKELMSFDLKLIGDKLHYINRFYFLSISQTSLNAGNFNKALYISISVSRI